MSEVGQAKLETSERVWRGLGVSSGVVVGVIRRVHTQANVVVRQALSGAHEIEPEVERLRAAIETARQQIVETKMRAEAQLGTRHADIFDAHLLMLQDDKLVDESIAVIRSEKVRADYAVRSVVDKLLTAYNEIEDEYLRTRAADIEDIAQRLMLILDADKKSVGDKSIHALSENTVIVAEELLPSLITDLDFTKVCALVSDAGGWTSHAVILARGLGIPTLIGLRDFHSTARNGDRVLIDANANLAVLHPSSETIKKHTHEKLNMRELPLASANYPHQLDDDSPPVTRDGVKIKLRANIELPIEFDGVKKYGAEGIGLYRSEFLWLQHARMPSEETQFQAYKQAVEVGAADGANIRLFDLNGDKAGFDAKSEVEREANPALGLRGIRLSLEYQLMLRVQVRACLRAAAHGRLRVVLPMVSDVSEVKRIKQIVENEKQVLRESSIAVGEIEIGAMIEVPSAVLTAQSLAREVSFFSLGTNDLVQYLLAVDRGNETVAKWYRTLHPAVLRAIKMTLDAAHAANIAAIVCGEMAATPIYAFLLVGLGARELSMTPAAIPRVRRVLSAIDKSYAESIADACLALEGADAVETYINRRMTQELPHIFAPDNLPAFVK